MPPETVIVPAVFLIPGAVITIRMWLSHKEKMAGIAAPAEQTHALEQRLARIEQTVDAIAVEMERVGEGQRFVTKLLADRSPALPAPAALQQGRVNTPH